MGDENNPGKRPRSEQPRRRTRRERIILDVGGTCFVTSVSTLTANSAYFRSKFSDEWRRAEDDGDDPVFVDQEPEPFAILLSYMRVGYVECESLDKKVLALAEFLGIDRLLYAVKARAFRNKQPDFEGENDAAVIAFDMKIGGIMDAIACDILPKFLFKKNAELKEFTSLYFRLPEGGAEIEACVSAPETSFNNTSNAQDDTGSHYVDRVPHCCTFLDALNWLSRNGFTKEEKSLQALCDAEVKFIVNYVVLGQLIFSRKRCASGVNFPVSTRESSSMLSNIIIGGASQDKEYGNTDDYQKDFAMITIRSGEVVVEADQGVLRDITVNGIVEASRINEVEGITTVEGGMNWLHRSNFTTREYRFESFYRDIIKNFQSYNDGQEEFETLEFMVFSRPLSASPKPSNNEGA